MLKSLSTPSRGQIALLTRTQTNQHRKSALSSFVCKASATQTAQPGLILSTGDKGSWDEAGVGNPVVRYYLGDNEQRWFMWYSGRTPECLNLDGLFPSSGSIGLATSTDGVNWERGYAEVKGERGKAKQGDIGRVLAPNTDSWWWHDTAHLHVSDVQILSSSSVGTGAGVYWCFYSGGSFEDVEVPDSLKPFAGGNDTIEGLRLRPGLAMSQDGRNWARIEAEHHTGALFDVGAEGEWDALFIGAPQVVNSGPGDLRMYYYSFDAAANKYKVGLATSPDGFKWTKQGPIFDGGKEGDFDSMGVTNRCVVRDVDTKLYFMFYEGVAHSGKRSIGLAISKDGKKNWERYPEPILTASDEPGAWDGGSVGCPWAVSMAQGRWRLYYAGRGVEANPTASGADLEAANVMVSGGWEGIGLSLSDVDSKEMFKGAPVKFKRRTGANS